MPVISPSLLRTRPRSSNRGCLWPVKLTGSRLPSKCRHTLWASEVKPLPPLITLLSPPLFRPGLPEVPWSRVLRIQTYQSQRDAAAVNPQINQDWPFVYPWRVWTSGPTSFKLCYSSRSWILLSWVGRAILCSHFTIWIRIAGYNAALWDHQIVFPLLQIEVDRQSSPGTRSPKI